jgi:WD40 repeat protein
MSSDARSPDSLTGTLPHHDSSSAGTRPLPVVPGYDLLGEIGRGGMGVVYEARDQSLNRVVALKMILAGSHADPEQLTRLRAEAEAVARLRHPNIVQIYQVGEHEGLPFLALEHIDGGSLDKKLSGTPQPPRWAAEIVQVLARAVQHAHEQNIIHRDLKPANVLVGQDGVLKITDFGLAKKVDVAGQTVSGTLIGSPEYMSPEQASGRVRDVGPRSDVYALGVILYELLTGRPPFKGASLIETLDQVRAQEPVPPQRLVPRLPRDLDTICLKCLGKLPRDRYATAGQLADDLQLFLDDKPITARPVGPLARAGRWARRNPVVAGLCAGVAALLVATVIVAGIAALEFRARAEVESQARADQEAQLYATRIAIAERELTLNQDVGLASTLLEKCPERLRGWEWDYLMRLRDGPRAPLTGHDGGLWMAVFSPDGRRLATASIDGTARIWDVATGRSLFTFRGHVLPQLPLAKSPPRVPVMCVAFSPDGWHVASGSLFPNPLALSDPRKALGVVKIWDPETGHVDVTFRGQVGLVDSLAYSPDGKRIASSSLNEDNTFAVWNADTGEDVHLVRGHATHVHRLRFSPDGHLIVSASTDGTVKLWDAATFTEVRSIDAHRAPVYDLAFSPDGSHFASASFDGTVCLWETASGARLRTLRGHTGGTVTVTYSPDGRRLASGGSDKTVRLWDPASGEEKITLRGHTDLVTSVAFSPDGRQLVSASFDRTAHFWDASPAQPPAGPGLFTCGDEGQRVNSVAFSPNGRLLASGGWDGVVRLWDGDTGTAVRPITGHDGAVWGVSFSPDGKRIASAGWDRSVKVHDTESGRDLVTFTGHKTPVHAVAFSPDGRRVVSSSWEGLVKIWDAATGQEIVSCAGHLFPALAVAFSPDGQRVASGSGDRTVKIWDVESGREVFTLKGHEGLVHGVVFSPDGQMIASASWDHTVKFWDARTGRELKTLHGHSDRVQCVAFARDGNRIATAGEDKTVRIWNVDTGQEVVPARYHRGVVWSVSFSPDGKRVASGYWSPTGGVRTWSAER